MPAARLRPSLARRLRRTAFAALSTLAIGASALVGADAASARTFVIGGKAFTEQYVLAEITRQLMEREGIDVRVRVGYATDTIRQAQLAGEIDIQWDYTWTGYAFHHGMTEYRPVGEVMEVVRELDLDNGLEWLEPSRVNNTYALAVNLDFAAEACIHSMPDLATAVRNGLQLRLASDQECYKREDCLLGAQEVYDFEIPSDMIDVMNVNDTYEALRERRAEVAVVYTTDGKIPAYDLEILEDPEGVFAEYFLVPVARTDALEEEPRIRAILNTISRTIDTSTLQDLHYRVDVVGQPIPEVAAYFIQSQGL